MTDTAIIYKALKGNMIFSVLDNNVISELACGNGIYLSSYAAGDTISDCERFSKALGIIVSGCAGVYRAGSEKKTLLRKLGKNDIFGVTSLFGDVTGFVTDIYAIKPSDIVYVPEDTFDSLIRRSPDLAVSYISFLSDRIRFLNKRISEFSASGAEGKFAKYLLGSESGTVSPNMVELASSLGIAHASLYRAVDSLISKGIISKSGKEITVLDACALAELI